KGEKNMRRRSIAVGLILAAAAGMGAWGGTRVPPLQTKGGAPAEDDALKGRGYADGEMNSALQGPGEKFKIEEAGPWAGDALKRAPTTASTTGATPETTEGDFVVKDFRFRDGETMGELRLHYATLGKPARDAAGGGQDPGAQTLRGGGEESP